MSEFLANAGFGLYRALATAAAPLTPYLLARRLAQGKESPERLAERRGFASLPRPDGRMIWLHGASVGESLSALPLITALLARDNQAHVLVTTGTVTSAALMSERLPPRAFHQFVPMDSPPFVSRFLDWWRPDVALWLESEFWPSLILGLEARRVPLVLVNGRMSEKSVQGWSRAHPLIRRLLGAFTQCLAQDAASAERLRRLGARSVVVTGNLKTDAEKLPADPDMLAALQAQTGGRPVWLAASTHPGEESLAAAAQMHVRTRLPDALLVIVPRHPVRGPELGVELAGLGHRVARRGAGEALDAATTVYLADTLGELGLFYRLAHAAFIGGSLVTHGGQNPYEPARLDCPILHGPHIHNFAEIYEQLDAGGGALPVLDPAALGPAVLSLLTDRTMARAQAATAARIIGDGGALAQTLGALEPFLRRGGAHAGA